MPSADRCKYRGSVFDSLPCCRLISCLLLWTSFAFGLAQGDSRDLGQLRFCYDTSNSDHRLNVAVRRELFALSGMDCILLCIKNDKCCRSVNYRKSPCYDGKENCELLDTTAEEQPPGYLMENDSYDHYILCQSDRSFDCNCSSCKNNGTCPDNSTECRCPDGFAGSQCEKDGIPESIILQGNQAFINQLKQWLPPKFKHSRLCYRATRHGWHASNFHSGCDNKGATVTIVKAGPYIFGGYADVSWGGAARFISSKKSFIFSFVNKDGLQPFKTVVHQAEKYAVHTDIRKGPSFGYDLYILNKAKSTDDSYTNIGYTYSPPDGYLYNQRKTQNLLAGSYYFTPDEVEVFSLG